MVTARTNDACVEGFCPNSRLRFLYSDVSETAVTLQQQHQLELPAALILSRALAGIALIGIDLGEQEETISLHTETDGRCGGYLVEMTGRGDLRGYIYSKIIPPPAESSTDSNEPYGSVARVKVTRTHESGRIRSQMAFSVMPAAEQNILMEFYNATLQIPTQVCTCATSFDNQVERVRALAVQQMPDGRKSEFKRVTGLFKDGTVSEQLEFDASVTTLREIFNLPELTTGPTRALRFGCTCSQRVAEASFASRSKCELDGLLRSENAQSFRCHLCGRVYTLPIEKIAELSVKAKAQ